MSSFIVNDYLFLSGLRWLDRMKMGISAALPGGADGKYAAGVAAFLPAMLLVLGVMSVAVLAHLMPFGRQMLLVRVNAEQPGALMRSLEASDALLVSEPRPGFAVVLGDAASVREHLGLAVLWKGAAPCTPNQK
jgi:hypothetical protein